MRKRHEEVSASLLTTTTTKVSGIQGHDEDCSSSCEDDYSEGRQECDDCARRADGLLMMVMRDDSMMDGEQREQVISLTPSLVITIEDPLSTATSTLSRTSSSSSSSSSFSTGSPTSMLSSIASTLPHNPSATTISTFTIIQSTRSLSPRTSSFTPTGYQSVVPTYPPFTSHSSTSTTNRSSLDTKLGLGLGIPILVLLVLLLTILLHRRQARLAKYHHHHHPYDHRQHPPSFPEMTTISTTDPAFPRLYPVPSSRLSTAGDMVVTPAPGVSSTIRTTTTSTPRKGTPTLQLYFPPPSSPPAVPRRNSARLLLPPGPLTSHPPAVRPTSSIYGGETPIRDSVAASLGGDGVGGVLAEYLDLNSQRFLDGPLPWNPDEVDVPPLVLPPKPVAKNGWQDQRRQYLSVDVDHGPGGIDEVSPLSSSSSEPQIPARISVMSGLSPSSPVRAHSRPRT